MMGQRKGKGVKSKHLTLAIAPAAEGIGGPLRVEFEEAIYHLCARGNARQAIFHDERDCARFLKLVSESANFLAAWIMQR